MKCNYCLRNFPIFIFLILSNFAIAQQKISLAGQWKFSLDPDSLGYRQNWSTKNFNQLIALPGTTDQAKYGTKTTGSDYGILTRAYKYIGPAWYQKTITIPAHWANKPTELYLERVLWESKVYVDGKLVSTLSPLHVPHNHNLGILKPGKHTLAICINNDLVHNIGDKGHGYSEYTQSIWNGIVGKIELRNLPSIHISNVKTYPDLAAASLKINVAINIQESTKNITLVAILKDKTTKTVIKTLKKVVKVILGKQQVEITLEQLKQLKSWDEFNPALYDLDVNVIYGKNTSSWSENVGFRKITTNQHQIAINDNPIFFRGNLDCIHFPLTGYPSTKIEDWEKIFKIYKSYGLNMVRFHSWCPPEAAFAAADKLGIYIQAEVLWIDWWMSGLQKDRPEMNTKGFPQGLGKNPNADAFTQAEMQRMIDVYGNHPSFIFFAIGNELGNSDFTVMESWVKKLKASDNRRLYAVSSARKITPTDDYNVTHNIPNVGGTYGNAMNSTNNGLEGNYSKATIPTIAHEVGQYPVYPEWKEIDKYTGVLKARNLEGFKKMAEKNGIVNQDKAFHQASGALQRLLYKNLIENIVLSPSSAGYQMLSMSDYQGQGEALVGWLDCFWDDKGTTSPAQFTQYANAVVPAIITKSFVYKTGDSIKIDAFVRNNFNAAIDAPLKWSFKDKAGNVILSGNSKTSNFAKGILTTADRFAFSVNQFPKLSAEYIFELVIGDHEYHNTWSFFVFNQEINLNHGDVLVTDKWDATVDATLAKGGKVILKANKLGTNQTSHAVYFSPLFWSSSFFPGQNNETLGSYVNEKHSIFKNFPTENYTNWQWQTISGKAKYFKLSDMPNDFQPIVQPVSDFHFNEKLGTIFETKVGNGKLLVCGYDLDLANQAVAKQLSYSILEYAKSDAFNPQYELPTTRLKQILQEIPVAETPNILPNQFKNASLYVKAGKNATDANWHAKADEVLTANHYSYQTANVKIYNNQNITGWIGKTQNISIIPPQGVKGYVYLHFINPKNEKLNGIVTLEGRELNTGDINSDGKWIKVFMMREDTNKGKLNLQIKSEAGSLIVSELVIVNED